MFKEAIKIDYNVNKELKSREEDQRKKKRNIGGNYGPHLGGGWFAGYYSTRNVTHQHKMPKLFPT